MTWIIMPQQQQRGAQMPPPGGAPHEAVKDRSAQDHERAGDQTGKSAEPARPGPTGVRWDEVVQPAAVDAPDDLPLPEGK
jgi:hypothetical protein